MKHPVLTNKYGIEFLKNKKAEFLGVEKTKTNISRKEQTVFCRCEEGLVYSYIVPDEDSVHNGCCLYWPLEYAAIIIACDKAGIKVRWKATNGYPLWPVWYTTPEKFAEFKQHYDSLIEKYS